MDHFERQLAQMMRDSEAAPAPFKPKHRERLWAGVRVRHRRRTARRAVGSVLAVVGLSVGLSLLPGHATRVEPSHPGPQPTTSLPTSAPCGDTRRVPERTLLFLGSLHRPRTPGRDRHKRAASHPGKHSHGHRDSAGKHGGHVAALDVGSAFG